MRHSLLDKSHVMKRRSYFRQMAVVAIALALLFCPTSRAIFSSSPPAAEPNVYNIKSFGAAGDGKTLDTSAINKTIDAAAAAGGGTVYFPAGNYLSVSIRLKSNIALYLDQGATIVAADTSNSAKYDPPEPNEWDKYQDFGHSHWHNSLIWGENLTNVSILGPGKIWGKGLVRSGSQSRTREQNEALRNRGRSRGSGSDIDVETPTTASAPGARPPAKFGYPSAAD